MDILELLSQATVNDINGVGLGDVMGIHFLSGRMVISISLDLFDEDDGEYDDPDDGAKDDIPEDDASQVKHLTVVAIGKRDGPDG